MARKANESKNGNSKSNSDVSRRSFMKTAAMGAGAVMNMLQRSKIVMVAEGLDVFKVPVPADLAGRTIADSAIRERTGCSVVATETERGMEVVPDPFKTLPANADILLIGTAEAEERFLELYGRMAAG